MKGPACRSRDRIVRTWMPPDWDTSICCRRSARAAWVGSTRPGTSAWTGWSPSSCWPRARVADADRRARFIQEAKAASALNHPNIITIHEIGEQDGQTFIVMELVDGKPLNELIPRKGMRLAEALRIAVQVADALTAAHAAGIVHRDLKPGNIMVDAQGRVKGAGFRPGQAGRAAIGRCRRRRSDAYPGTDNRSPRKARSSAACPTCRRSRRKASRWMRAATSSLSARCSTR